MDNIRIYQLAMNQIAKETAGFEGLGRRSPATTLSTPPPVLFKRFNSGSFSNSSFSPSVASSSMSQTPPSQLSILVTGNQFSREVVLDLASNSIALKRELVTIIGKEENNIRMIDGGKEFMEALSTI